MHDFIPFVEFPTHDPRLKLAFTNSFESWKHPKSVFWIYLCHQDFIKTFCSQDKGFKKNSVCAQFAPKTTVGGQTQKQEDFITFIMHRPIQQWSKNMKKKIFQR